MAVVAPLLVALGFQPVVAVSVPAIGYSWSVTFGSIASSFQALIAPTSLPGEPLAPWSAIFLALACLGCGCCAAYAYDGWRALRRGFLPLLLIGLAMGGTQYFLATRGMWNIAAFMAGVVGLGVGALVAWLPAYRGGGKATFPGLPAPDQAQVARRGNSQGAHSAMGLPLALSAYLILVVIVVSAELIPPLKAFLSQVVLRVDFPAIVTRYRWTTPAGVGRTIDLFSHAGALLAYTALIAYGPYWGTGHCRAGALRRIVAHTVRSAVCSSLGIAAMVGMAMFMSHSGMTQLLAEGLSRSVGRAFPLVSSFIGLLGAFMTGSNTNSNVIFATLQQQTAELLAVSASVILGAQRTGGGARLHAGPGQGDGRLLHGRVGRSGGRGAEADPGLRLGHHRRDRPGCLAGDQRFEVDITIAERGKRVSFGRRHRLALQGAALVVVLSAPVALYGAAQAGNRPLLWGLLAIMAVAITLAVWVG